MCRDLGYVVTSENPMPEKLRRKATRMVLRRLLFEGCHELRVTENTEYRIEAHGKQSATARRMVRELEEWKHRTVEAVTEADRLSRIA